MLLAALAGSGYCASVINTTTIPPNEDESTLPCQEKELDHFRREYENCNRKAFAEIEDNFDGEVRRSVLTSINYFIGTIRKVRK